jgi:hypothetical protein
MMRRGVWRNGTGIFRWEREICRRKLDTGALRRRAGVLKSEMTTSSEEKRGCVLR